jgi:perosamine synthetase
MIPLSIPSITGNEWRYVKECLDTGWVSTAGPFVERFEEACRTFTGARFAVACMNGTSALHVALRLVGVSFGDEVIVPTITFIAPINAVRYLGAEPVFVDCDEYYNIDPDGVLDFLQNGTCRVDGRLVNKVSGRRVAAVVAVHVFGNAARLAPLLEMCREQGIPLVEDASESLGTVYERGECAGRHTGTVGDIGCFSFNGNKIITTGGGGAIVTDDEAMARRAKYLTTQAKDDEVRFVHGDVGYNYRMTNLQAALGVAQFEELPAFLEAKRRIYRRYSEDLSGCPGLRVADVPEYASNNCWLTAVQIDASVYGLDREQVMSGLAAAGIQTRPLWLPNHLQQAYRQCEAHRLHRAGGLFANTLTIPSSVGLTDAERHEVVARLLR